MIPFDLIYIIVYFLYPKRLKDILEVSLNELKKYDYCYNEKD